MKHFSVVLLVLGVLFLGGEIKAQSKEKSFSISSVDFDINRSSVQLNYFSFESFRNSAKSPELIQNWNSSFASIPPDAEISSFAVRLIFESKNNDLFKHNVGISTTEQRNFLFSTYSIGDTLLSLSNKSRYLSLQVGSEMHLDKKRLSLSVGVGFSIDIPIRSTTIQDTLHDSMIIANRIRAKEKAQFSTVLPTKLFVRINERSSVFAGSNLVFGLGSVDGSPLRFFGAGLNFGLRWHVTP